MKNKFIFLTVVVLLILLQSCKNDNTYRVHDAFAEYVYRFEQEAAQRGRNFDFKSSGLIVEFADLKDNLAGLCHYEKPIRIEIDKQYWKKMRRYAGADLVCEELIFHELGHGVLNRRHLNTTLENNEWKSMMCGGDSIPDKTWNINYRGMRRSYYLDELFNQNTPPPEFISTLLPIDTTGYNNLYFENFNSANPLFWDPSKTKNPSLTIQNQELVYKSQSTNNLAVLVNVSSVNILDDFCFEFSFRSEGSNPTSRYGLVFGNSTTSLDFFLINNNQEMTFGNNRWFSYFTKIKNNHIIPSENNHLKVLKDKEMLYYFINDAYVYSGTIEIRGEGFNFGFMVPAFSTLYLDNFGIGRKSHSQDSTKQQKTVSKPSAEIEVVEMEIAETYTRK